MVKNLVGRRFIPIVVMAEDSRATVDLGSRLCDSGDVVKRVVWIWIIASVQYFS
jgi:hypothetical protein